MSSASSGGCKHSCSRVSPRPPECSGQHADPAHTALGARGGTRCIPFHPIPSHSIPFAFRLHAPAARQVTATPLQADKRRQLVHPTPLARFGQLALMSQPPVACAARSFTPPIALLLRGLTCSLLLHPSQAPPGGQEANLQRRSHALACPAQPLPLDIPASTGESCTVGEGGAHSCCQLLAPTLRQHCINTAPTLRQHCINTAPTLHQHCTTIRGNPDCKKRQQHTQSLKVYPTA
jgi:hypothetical protein